MMSGMLLETCSAFNEQWNNKFYYKVASCWLFLQSHTTMHGSMNIKSLEVVWEDTGEHNKTSTTAFTWGGGGILQKNSGESVWSPKGP